MKNTEVKPRILAGNQGYWLLTKNTGWKPMTLDGN